MSGTLGDAFGEGVSQGRLRKVLVHLLGATVDATQYMTDDVDCLIVGANASGPKIQKADCSPTTDIILAAEVLAVLKPDDTKEAVRLWRASQTDLMYFEPDGLEFLRGQVVYITGGLGLRGFTKDEDLMRVFDGYGATLCLVRDRRSTANLCVHGDLPTESSHGLDVAREQPDPRRPRGWTSSPSASARTRRRRGRPSGTSPTSAGASCGKGCPPPGVQHHRRIVHSSRFRAGPFFGD